MLKRVGIFLAFCFALSWGVAFFIMKKGGIYTDYAQLLVIIMLIPAISVLITRKLSGHGFKDMWFAPKFKANIKIYLMAWFLTPGLIAIGAIVYFLIFPQHFDAQLTLLAVQFEAMGQSLSQRELISMVIYQSLFAVVIAPIFNFIPCLGEELGWRGYLLPGLCERFSARGAIIISGIIWGLWHSPLTAMGHNYGLDYPGFPWVGILAMTAFCIFTGSFLSWLTLKSGSVIPAAIAHGSLNGVATLGLFFTKDSPNLFIGPLPIGIIGGIGFIVAGVICFIFIPHCKGWAKAENI